MAKNYSPGRTAFNAVETHMTQHPETVRRLSVSILARVLLAWLTLLAACGSGPVTTAPAAQHLVSFDIDGRLTQVRVADQALLQAPARPDRGPANYFVGWFLADAGEGYMWDFKRDKVKAGVTLRPKFVPLSAGNVVVDAYLDEARRNAFTFRTLQELKAANIANDTTVNFTPGVYWTDDYKDPNNANTPAHPGLVGISFTQSGLTFKGLTSNADDVRIAGNRGHSVGSNGNWNVIGIGTRFSAYHLSFGNYASVDLVFPRDPSQNLRRRGDARVQAQTITSAGGPLDRLHFENVRFVSFLNLIAVGPVRAYFKDSYFQLTDDAIAGGTLNVFENCTFDFHGSHPSWGGSSTMAVFLNSTFNFLNDSPVFWFSKSGGSWALIDNVFKGPKEEIRWENIQRPDVKHYVHNNRYADGTPVVFDPRHPQVTQALSAEALKIFKVGEAYNVHNLLKGSDGWDPSSQQARHDSAFKMTMAAGASSLQSNDPANEVAITPTFTPANAFAFDAIRFDHDKSLFTLLPNSGDGKLHLRAKLNATGRIIDTVVKATAPNGLVAQVTLHVQPAAVNPPVVMGTPAIALSPGLARLELAYDHPAFTDASTVTWYRGSAPGQKAVQVAVTMRNVPYRNYALSAGDVGHYLTAVVLPRYEFSAAASSAIEVASPRAVTAADVPRPHVIATDFANISWAGHALNQPDVWYADTIKPGDVVPAWVPSTAAPWAHVVGDRDGAVVVPGLATATQGARLLYQPQGVFSDMALALELTPEKVAGQGFGSATDQYLEVYIKWDPATRTGYALRFQRLSSDPLNGGQPIPSSGNSVRVSMLEYVNGTAVVLPGAYVESSVFMPGAKLVFRLVGKVLSADVTTRSPQTSTQAGYGLPHELHFSATLPRVTSTVGGFGVQFTGTASAGNRTLLEKVEVTLKPR
ncbi:hypothetical protein [Roseateles sp. P5_E7]